MGKKRREVASDKGAAIATGRLKRLRQDDHTWEADFRALPKPLMQSETHYLGVVVLTAGGSVLAQSQVEGKPTANDLAALLTDAMQRPLTGQAHRPRRLHLRGTDNGRSYSRTWKRSASTCRCSENSRG